MNDKTEYADRILEDLEPHYSKHVSAMTTEGLHAKSAIAAELAWRDQEVERLQELNNLIAMHTEQDTIDKLEKQNASLAARIKELEGEARTRMDYRVEELKDIILKAQEALKIQETL